MRELYPVATDEVDLAAAYALPAATSWLHRWHLRANMVSSVDGAAGVSGGSAVLTTPGDLAVLKTLRDWADVIVVGVTTAELEPYPPRPVTAERQQQRRSLGSADQPRCAVVSNNLSLDPSSSLFSTVDKPTIVITHAAAPADRLAALSEVAEVCIAGDTAVNLTAALDWLAARGLRRVLCEGGPTLLGSLFSADLVDEMCLTISPHIAGDPAAIPVATGITAAHQLQLVSVLEEEGALFLRYQRGIPT